MSDHALLSPSAAHRWVRCPGSLALDLTCGAEDTSSVFADEGTAAHELAQRCLDTRRDADAFLGTVIELTNGSRFAVDDEMAGHVQTYLDAVRQFAEGHELLVEQRVDFSGVLNLAGCFGTADALVATADGRELQVHDLKYGRGVKVEARHNEQLMLYALGALHQFDMLYAFERVRLVIHQPRLGHLTEWDCALDELRTFGAEAARQGALALHHLHTRTAPSDLPLAPGEKQCRFCKAKADCPALLASVTEALTGDLQDLSEDSIRAAVDDLPGVFNLSLGRKLALVDLVEQWCKAVRARAESELLAGHPVEGFKLVEGRRGARAWSDAAAAEELFRSMRLKAEDMYDFSLISPTTAEKRAKAGTIGPRQWPKVQALIVQSAGKPSVAPAHDKRPALNPIDDLVDIPNPTADQEIAA
jgi:hypothetical protein